MNIDRMKTYFQNRELGLQCTVSEYAVLLPLVEQDGKLCLLYETRAETLVGHQPGEVCFPGGRREKGEKPVDTALRETWEELGIPTECIEVLAPLDVVQDISDRVIYPFLARVKPEGVEKLKESASEVKNTFCVPLDFLLDYEEEVYRYPVRFESDDKFPFAKVGLPNGYKWRSGWMDIPIYEYEGHIIWGLTGRMTRWFLDHLRKLAEEETP